MSWEQRYCPNRACTDMHWMVRKSSFYTDVWWVAQDSEGAPVTIAGSTPACPRCGATLCTRFELEGGFGHSQGPETGPLFDFVRSLAYS